MSEFFRPPQESLSAKLDIRNPKTQREMLLNQEPKLLEAAGLLAARIKACPSDSRYPELQPQALIVGGFVRDALFGAHPKDADMEVYGLHADRLESLLDQLFPDKVNKVGKAFGILKVAVEPGIEFDVSIPRRDSKQGTGHTGFVVSGDPTMTIKEAARRRDFTFNALAADPLTGEVFDEFGGIEDVRLRQLRVTDPKLFQDDPLRVYRGMQFVGRMDLSVEKRSMELMKEMAKTREMSELPPDRIREEFSKLLLKAPRPSRGFEFAREVGLIKEYFPELHALIDVPQEKEWHPEGDVWIHSMMVVDAAANIVRDQKRGLSEDEKVQIMFGALAHDFGKPSTTEIKDGRIRSINHEEAGRIPARAFSERLRLSNTLTRVLETVAAEHLKPDMLWRAYQKDAGLPKALKNYANAVRKLLSRIHPVSWRVLIAASEADSRGRTLPDAATKAYQAGLFMAEVVTRYQLDVEPTKKLVGGKDILALVEEFGLPRPKPVDFGKYIAEVERLRDQGELVTKDDGLNRLKELLVADNKKLPS